MKHLFAFALISASPAVFAGGTSGSTPPPAAVAELINRFQTDPGFKGRTTRICNKHQTAAGITEECSIIDREKEEETKPKTDEIKE